ncbi:ribosome maturation factor RimM [Variovorax sp. PCZ-1]|uniref:ribosome maturation factor RimM n=1 Tax=Variovorax sp. PCZ-1 TaxID=2835533 RepID=UPI001BCF86DC|nr:ribosome maturation factor RimM [Variovorax sp. PCZ-1]MBS7808007.1 ribosome maturation factor RimM [Variovorax sp. PCZ-1]
MAVSLGFLEPTELPPDAIEVGRIGDAWGIKGWFKIIPYSASPEALFSSKSWILLPPEPRAGVVAKEQLFKAPQLIKIRTSKEHSDGVVAQADGVDDRNTAELLKSCRIFIARSSFPTASKDEYYWVDLIGCEVVNREGIALGTVKDLMATGPQTVIVAEREVEGKAVETLIPFVDAYVDTVSLQDKRITVDWQLDY